MTPDDKASGPWSSSVVDAADELAPPEMDEALDAFIEGLVGDVRALRAEVAQLHEALVSRATIDQAKGMLMSRYGVDADAAFGILARWSSISNTKLCAVAQALVDVAVHGVASPGVDATVRELVSSFEALERSNGAS